MPLRLDFTVYLCLLARLTLADETGYIVSKDYDEFKKTRKPEIMNACLLNEMSAYGLVGDSEGLGTPNKLCPKVQGNCCGPRDTELILRYWETDHRHIEFYYRLVLSMFKYMIGYFPQYSNMAIEVIYKYEDANGIDHRTKRLLKPEERKRKAAAAASPPRTDKDGKKFEASSAPSDKNEEIVIDDGVPLNGRVRKQFTFDTNKLHYKVNSQKFCYDAARAMLKQDFVDPEKAAHFYALLNKKTEFMNNARRGFYCSLCSAKNKKHVMTRGPFTRWVAKDTIVYSREFCQILYRETFSTVYEIWKSLNPFISNLNRMLSCLEPLEGHPKSDKERNDIVNLNWALKDPMKGLPPLQRQLFENPMNIEGTFKMEVCYDADPTSFFFSIRCQFYCQKFKLTTPDSLMDFDLDALRRVYVYLQRFEFALYMVGNDVFNNDVLDLKREVEVNYLNMGPNRSFFRSMSPVIDFKRYLTFYDTDNEGVNPIKDADDSVLYFRFQWAGVLGAVVAALLGITAL